MFLSNLSLSRWWFLHNVATDRVLHDLCDHFSSSAFWLSNSTFQGAMSQWAQCGSNVHSIWPAVAGWRWLQGQPCWRLRHCGGGMLRSGAFSVHTVFHKVFHKVSIFRNIYFWCVMWKPEAGGLCDSEATLVYPASSRQDRAT